STAVRPAQSTAAPALTSTQRQPPRSVSATPSATTGNQGPPDIAHVTPHTVRAGPTSRRSSIGHSLRPQPVPEIAQPPRAEPAHLEQLVDTGEPAVLLAEADDPLSEGGPHPRERLQLRRGRRVEAEWRSGRAGRGPARAGGRRRPADHDLLAVDHPAGQVQPHDVRT